MFVYVLVVINIYSREGFIMDYIKIYEEWIKGLYFDEDIKLELENIKNNEKEIEDRFYKDLEFGIVGFRGIIEVGMNRINKYIVRRVIFGLVNYILENIIKEEISRGVVIVYDNRYKFR